MNYLDSREPDEGDELEFSGQLQEVRAGLEGIAAYLEERKEKGPLEEGEKALLGMAIEAHYTRLGIEDAIVSAESYSDDEEYLEATLEGLFDVLKKVTKAITAVPKKLISSYKERLDNAKEESLSQAERVKVFKEKLDKTKGLEPTNSDSIRVKSYPFHLIYKGKHSKQTIFTILREANKVTKILAEKYYPLLYKHYDSAVFELNDKDQFVLKSSVSDSQFDKISGELERIELGLGYYLEATEGYSSGLILSNKDMGKTRRRANSVDWLEFEPPTRKEVEELYDLMDGLTKGLDECYDELISCFAAFKSNVEGDMIPKYVKKNYDNIVQGAKATEEQIVDRLRSYFAGYWQQDNSTMNNYFSYASGVRSAVLNYTNKALARYK